MAKLKQFARYQAQCPPVAGIKIHLPQVDEIVI